MAFIRSHRVRELLRLQRAALEQTPSEQDQRDHLLEGFVRLIGAEIGLFVEDPEFVRGGNAPLRSMSAHNLEPVLCATEMIIEDRTSSPILAKLLDGGRQRIVTVRGKTDISKREWYRCAYFDEGIRPSGCDEVMGAALPLEGNAVLGINVARARGEAAFTEEDAAVLSLFLESCGPLLRKRLSPAERFGLTPRQQQVFEQLLVGASNKEISVLLACSLRTAEVHVAAVLRKCGVKTRAQLPALMKTLPRP